MAEIIFHDTEKLAKVNAMLHPAVRDYITEEIAKEQKSDKLDYLFIEAALLIEEHYDEIVDELWYVYADTETRRRRLKEKRGYSDDKIDNIMEKQLTDDVFREKCQFVIDNSDKLAYTYEQINGRMEE
jgi:dephospho-CoA kinase